MLEMRCGVERKPSRTMHPFVRVIAHLAVLLCTTGERCDDNEYQSSAIVFGCSAGSGHTDLAYQKAYSTVVTTFPAGASDVQVTVQADIDVDIMLLDSSHGACVVGYGCDYSQGCANEDDYCINYKGMQIYFSGDRSIPPLRETVSISGTLSRSMRIEVRAYGAGTGFATYSHGAFSPCPSPLPGCAVCSAYPNCGAHPPVCDGSTNVVCDIPTSPTTIRSISPQSVTSGVATWVTLEGTIGTGDSMSWASDCAIADAFEVPVTGTNAESLFTLPSIGLYKLCFKRGGSSQPVEQAGIELTVVKSTRSTRIAGIFPTSISEARMRFFHRWAPAKCAANCATCMKVKK